MADNDGYFLRPEAGPVPYRALQKRQQDVLKKVVRALIAAVDRAAGRPEIGKGHDVDTDRESRLFFISAEPGCGKSTLYLTLKAMLDQNNDQYWADGYDGPGLGRLQNAVRWLEPIDLEIADDETENLLAAVVVRLRDTLLDESDAVFSKPCQDAIRLLEELASDIGMAWDSNLKARAAALDPDSYSMEVMRAQRARLGVSKRLRKSLDQLAINKCCGCADGTLFILPVDDFYLKPDASLQLLRLLRMISVPRLFFLIMGDIKAVEALFVEKVLADWTAVAGPEVFAALPERQGEVLARARELRARHLRKLVPPDQRAIIQVMDWDEGMKFKPERIGSETADHKGLPEMWELLKKMDRDPPAQVTGQKKSERDPMENLLDFIVSPCWEGSSDAAVKGAALNKLAENEKATKKALKRAQEAYTALQILDATPREIMDLWIAFYERSKGSINKDSDIATQTLLMRVLEFVGLAIDEQDFLVEKQQKILSGVLPTRHYRRDLYLDASALKLRPDGSRWDLRAGGEVWVRKHLAWNVTVDGSSVSSDPFAKLPPRPTAWIVLLHDLAWKRSPTSLTGNLIERLGRHLKEWSEPTSSKPEKAGDAVTKQEFVPPSSACVGWAVYRDGNAYKHFLLPDEFKTFRDVDRFLWIWSSGLDAQINLEHRREFEELWEFAKTTILEEKYSDFANNNEDWFKGQFDTFKGARANDSRKV